jgi:hypothetical protein
VAAASGTSSIKGSKGCGLRAIVGNRPGTVDTDRRNKNYFNAQIDFECEAVRGAIQGAKTKGCE